MKEKKIGKILAIVLLILITCITQVLIIGIQIANNRGKQIADIEDIEAKSEEILAVTAGQTWTYGATGGVQTFTVPATGTYTFNVTGAAGAEGYHNTIKEDGSREEHVMRGGYGTRMTGKVKLTQGTVLYLYVGAKGSGTIGGWNGGGNGAGHKEINQITYEGTTYTHRNTEQGYSGGGGGASDIRLGGTGLENRILVAPGGAGSGFSFYCSVTKTERSTNTGGHNNSYYDGQYSNGQISGRGSDYIFCDNSYWENGEAWMRRLVYSGGGGGGYYGGETLLLDDQNNYVKTLGSGRRTQDSFGFTGTPYYNANLVSDVSYITRNSSIYSDVVQTDGANGLNGSITITLDHEHAYQIISSSNRTCTQAGTVTKRCTICNDEIVEVAPALGHDTTGEYVYATNNNIENGIRYKDCKRCGIRLETAYLLSLNKGSGIDTVAGGGYYASGTPVTAGATVIQGCVWKDWTGTYTSTNQNYTFNMPENAVALTANAECRYRVNHYQQNLSDYKYTLKEAENLTAPLGTSVTPNVKTYEGYVSPKTQTVVITGDNSIVVDYYYNLIPPEIENNIKITADTGYKEEETNIPVLKREKGTVTYNIEYTANIKRYVGKAKTEIVVLLPANIDTKKSDLAGGTYNENAHTITWVQDINIDTTATGAQRVEVTKQIGIVYNGQDVTKDLVTQAGGKIITYYPESYEEKPGQELVKKTATDKVTVKQVYKVNYRVQKIWEDNDNIEGKRPNSITVTILLMPQNKRITKILNEENNWTYEETGLPKYVKETGEKIIYSVIESETNKNDLEYYEDDPEIIRTEEQTNEVTNYMHVITNKYREMNTDLKTELTKKGPEEITSLKDEVDYTISYKAEIKEYIGEGKVKLVDELPYEIDEQKSQLDGGKYDKETKTITWEEELPHINTFKTSDKNSTEPNTYKLEIIKQIKLLYKDIDLTQQKMSNKLKGQINLYYKDIIKEDIAESVDTNINIMVYDFSIDKTIEKITLNGQDVKISDKSLAKVEIKTKDVKNTDLVINYNIQVTNNDEIKGIAKVLEQLPDGCKVEQMPEYWRVNKDGTLMAEIELDAKETKNLKLTLRWVNNEKNLGSKVNKAKILNPEELKNNDGINLADYTSEATVVISIKTGQVVSGIIIVMIIGALGICGYISYSLMGRKGPNIRRIRYFMR